MKENEIRAFSKLILTVNMIVLFVVSIVLLILKQYSWLIGYLFGSITSYITYLMHANNVSKLGLSSKHPVRSSVSSAILRLCISAVSLLIALYVSWINIYATFIGLLVIKLTVIIVSFILEINKSKGGNVET